MMIRQILNELTDSILKVLATDEHFEDYLRDHQAEMFKCSDGGDPVSSYLKAFLNVDIEILIEPDNNYWIQFASEKRLPDDEKYFHCLQMKAPLWIDQVSLLYADNWQITGLHALNHLQITRDRWQKEHGESWNNKFIF